MSWPWYALPGPARMLGRITDALDARRSCIVVMPTAGVRDITGAIESATAETLGWLHGDPECIDAPFESIARTVGLEDEHAFESSPELLAEHPDLAGRAFLVRDIPLHAWPGWERFLRRVEPRIRGRDAWQRPLFCCVVRGLPPDRLPREEVALAVIPWDDAFTKTDALLWASMLAADLDEGRLARRVRAAVTAELALWDVDLAERLIRLSLAELLQPDEALRATRDSYQWSGSSEARWESGQRQRFDGVDTRHSADLRRAGDADEVRRRIWRGQVATLFPFVEEQRQRLVRRYAGRLRPVTAENGERVKPQDLEIGQICWQLVSNGGARIMLEEQQVIRRLRDVRNDLAHLRTVSAEQLADERGLRVRES